MIYNYHYGKNLVIFGVDQSTENGQLAAIVDFWYMTGNDR